MAQDVRIVDIAGLPVIDNTDLFVYWGSLASMSLAVIVAACVVCFVAIKVFRGIKKLRQVKP